ncbi:hypothetical protein NXY11_19750 [Parabacteroides faecis]|uniref:hypothetical protein n=1 Tax=Parabacteroides faecis TaxID=1217282 RepID=UPI0021641976|nr:hypothetical protein [Parabacteroides faecis]MCS2890965.1 hypothetical protein [Parabacteroides faecis]UVQ45381.1 hypothetical protein NXY11_19750 [Parabacteroides faecis]
MLGHKIPAYIYGKSNIVRLVLLLPYLVLHFYFSYQEKERLLRLLEEDRAEAANKLSKD